MKENCLAFQAIPFINIYLAYNVRQVDLSLKSFDSCDTI